MGRVTRVFHRGETQTSLVKIETREPINEYVPFYLRDVGVLPFPTTIFTFRPDGPIISRNPKFSPKPKIFPPSLSLSLVFNSSRDSIRRNRSQRESAIDDSSWKNSILGDRKKVPTRMCKTMGQCQSTIMVAAECDSPTSLRSTHLVRFSPLSSYYHR